jgi:hypothetical protein
MWTIKLIQGILIKTRVQAKELGMDVRKNGDIWDWI